MTSRAPLTGAVAKIEDAVTSGSSSSEIRAWGIANGYAVGVRGRLSQS
ncbi:MAG: Lsr2 family DNA-binding protein [Microbacterium sp.]